MKFKNASRHFDQTRIFDAYTGAELFKAQFSAFNDSNAIGSTSVRRVLSMAPGLTRPARRCIRVYGDVWILGDGNPDDFNGEIIRQSFNMRKETDLVQAKTPAQLLLGALTPEFYIHKTQFKDTGEPLTDSDLRNFWNIYASPTENIAQGLFISNGITLFRVRNHYLPVEDLTIAECDQLENLVSSGTFSDVNLDPVTEQPVGSSWTTNVLLLNYNQLYLKPVTEAAKESHGDKACLVAISSGTPRVGQKLTVSGAAWRILAVATEIDAYLLHLRREQY